MIKKITIIILVGSILIVLLSTNSYAAYPQLVTKLNGALVK